ncbi:two-component system response regulator YesN [Salibacterium salarium]|uniref:response regulator transcription factor n=1 Tax=Salibacterium salarium TaxID=284579 RepID=UPI0027852764|nr:response regulator [Salibacterium salarium]MDQ0298155.1 two-component system response regulator YesN [Salibacterium salarium]
MNIIIAEDEILERKAMRKFLEFHFKDITIVGEAVNGRTAIELALDTNPDIILMDIKMPGINGMKAIETIQAYLPDVQFIMVTAYDSFDYAKQAIKLGVKEYILKPGKKNETIEAIERVKKQIEQVNKGKKEYDHTVELAKQLFLSKIIHEEEGLEELQQELYPFMTSGFFLILEGQDNTVVSITAQQIKQWTRDDVIVNQERGKQVIVQCMSERHRDVQEVARLKKRIRLECGTSWIIGSGNLVHTVEMLSRSYYEALLDVQKQKRGTVETERNDQNILVRIRDAVQEGEVQIALTNTLLLMERPANQALKEELFYLVKQVLDKQQVHRPEMTVHHINTDQQWYEFIQSSCQRVIQHYQSLNSIERAKQWIDKHIHESFSLEDIAEKASLSPAYFSNLFKATTGENVTDYITRHRLQKAVVLLKEQKYSLKEISSFIGYKDPNYFSRVFKKYYNLSPKQFQKATLKK